MIRHALVLPFGLALGLFAVGCGQGPAREQQAPLATVVAAIHAAPTTTPSVDALATTHDDEGTDLRRTLQADPDPAARRAALDQWTRSARDVQPIVDALFTDPDPLVRRWAALALERAAKTEAPRVGPAITQALSAERDPAVRSILARVERRLAR